MLMENPCGWKCNLVHKHGNDSLERNGIVCEKQACHWVRCVNALSQEFLSSNGQFCVFHTAPNGGQARTTRAFVSVFTG